MTDALTANETVIASASKKVETTNFDGQSSAPSNATDGAPTTKARYVTVEYKSELATRLFFVRVWVLNPETNEWAVQETITNTAAFAQNKRVFIGAAKRCYLQIVDSYPTDVPILAPQQLARLHVEIP